jgi:hypothetical protein
MAVEGSASVETESIDSCASLAPFAGNASIVRRQCSRAKPPDVSEVTSRGPRETAAGGAAIGAFHGWR